jgi:putative hydrolase
MALAAVELGHEYLVLTDHSPTLKVANGLSPARLRRQLDHVARLNDALPDGFRILTGIEVDILEDGSLDQEDALLARLDVVVGSVHSKLRDESPRMTKRMLAAIANPHLDVLGHMTGRKVSAAGEGDRGHRGGRTRPPSTFDLEKVIAAAVEHDKAIEINSRPDRLDPPKRMLTVAVEAGCKFTIDTDAHAPGQLDWLGNGCTRAALCAVPVDDVVNTWPVERLLAWTGTHSANSGTRRPARVGRVGAWDELMTSRTVTSMNGPSSARSAPPTPASRATTERPTTSRRPASRPRPN